MTNPESACSRKLSEFGAALTDYLQAAHRDDGKHFVVHAGEKFDRVCGTRIGNSHVFQFHGPAGHWLGHTAQA